MLGTRFEEYPPEKLPFRLSIGLERTATICSAETNWHENPEIQLCDKGAGYVLLDGRKREFLENDVIVVNSGVVHYTSTDGYLSYSCLILSPDFCRAAAIDYASVRFCEHLRDEIVADLFREIVRVYEGTEICRTAKLQILTLRLLVELRENHVSSCRTCAETDPAFERVKQAIRYIRARYTEKIALDAVAAGVCADKYRLSREFKALTGQTVVAYINQYRCGRVSEQILNGATVREAAERCGFNTMSYFSKTYRRYMGNLPSEAKKSR